MNCYSWFWRRSIVLVRTSTQSCLPSRCSQSRDAPLSRAWCTPRPPAVNYPSHTRHNLSLIISKSRLAIKWKFRKKTRWLYCVKYHNTRFGSKRSAAYAQAVYFLQSTVPSVTCVGLSHVSVIFRATYFQFPIWSAFLPCRSASRTAAYWFITQYRT